MPLRFDLAVWRGNTESWTFGFKQPDGQPLDLTGSTLVLRIAGIGVSIEKTGPSASIAVPTPANGQVTINLSVADTSDIPDGVAARYELERRIGGEEKTILYGMVNATGWVNTNA